MFLISWILPVFFFKNSVYIRRTVFSNPLSPVLHRSPEHLERYWLTCLQVHTLNGWCPNLLDFQHVSHLGCSFNLVSQCPPLLLLVVYKLHHFYFFPFPYLSNSWFLVDNQPWIYCTIAFLVQSYPCFMYGSSKLYFPLLYYNTSPLIYPYLFNTLVCISNIHLCT